MCVLFLARDSRIFTVMESMREELLEIKDMLRSMQRRMVLTDADNTVNVLQELDLPLKDCSSVAALEEKLPDTAYQQCVVSCFVVVVYYARENCLPVWLAVTLLVET